MYIRSLELSQYRNYEKLHIKFDEGINVIYGANAQGKTNILESIYICSSGRSHRGCRDNEIVNFSSDEAHVKLMAEKKGVPLRIDLHLKKKGTKGVAVNGYPVKKTSDILGWMNIVLFAPEDLNIIKRGPSERRRFINNEICQLDRYYTAALTEYNKILENRNELLKNIDRYHDHMDLLDIIDEQLAVQGRYIISSRDSFIKEMNNIIKDMHSRITAGSEEISMIYENDCGPENFLSELKGSFNNDIKLKYTTKGPHHDDIKFIVNGADVKKYGSQGQQRSAALSLKLSEIELKKKRTGDMPVLLLDDVLSELDHERQCNLLENINDIQSIITCTGLDDLVENNLDIDQVIRIKNGAAYTEKHSEGIYES